MCSRAQRLASQLSLRICRRRLARDALHGEQHVQLLLKCILCEIDPLRLVAALEDEVGVVAGDVFNCALELVDTTRRLEKFLDVRLRSATR